MATDEQQQTLAMLLRALKLPAFAVHHLLEKELRRLDGYDAVIIDDIGYIQQSSDEMGVLFTFLSQRYERESVLITSNLVLSQWDRIYKDAMTTAAAIDRVVHHALILELTEESYRGEKARSRETVDKAPRKAAGDGDE